MSSRLVIDGWTVTTLGNNFFKIVPHTPQEDYMILSVATTKDLLMPRAFLPLRLEYKHTTTGFADTNGSFGLGLYKLLRAGMLLDLYSDTVTVTDTIGFFNDKTDDSFACEYGTYRIIVSSLTLTDYVFISLYVKMIQ